MQCLRCGYPKSAHCRADGSCVAARCEEFIDKWPEAAPSPSLPDPDPIDLPKKPADTDKE